MRQEALRGEPGSITLPSMWTLVWRYKFLIAAIAAVFTAAAVTFALLATPMYRAEVTITAVSNQGMGRGGALLSQLGALGSLAGVDLNGGDPATRDAKLVLESRFLIEEFIQRHKLQATLARGGKPPTLWNAVESFEKDVVTIADDPRKGRSTVAIEWTDPKVAATWANDLVALANELVRARAKATAQRNIDYLNKQLAQTNVVELQKVMYNIIEQETKTLMLANAQPEYAFAIIDPAVAPEERFKPKRTVIAILGFVLGVLVGIAVAFALNALRQEKRESGAVG